MPSDIIAVLAELTQRCGIHYGEIAAGAGVAPTTVRRALEVGQLPVRADSRTRLIKFANANRDAQTRADVRFV